jgi:hypothetical protein
MSATADEERSIARRSFYPHPSALNSPDHGRVRGRIVRNPTWVPLALGGPTPRFAARISLALWSQAPPRNKGSGRRRAHVDRPVSASVSPAPIPTPQIDLPSHVVQTIPIRGKIPHRTGVWENAAVGYRVVAGCNVGVEGEDLPVTTPTRVLES